MSQNFLKEALFQSSIPGALASPISVDAPLVSSLGIGIIKS